MNMAQKLRQQMGIGKTPVKINFEIKYAHTDTNIVVVFGQSIDNLTMTVEQCESMIKMLGEVHAAFVKHQESKNVRA